MNSSGFRFLDPDQYSAEELNRFVGLLRLQGKVQNPSLHKLQRCKLFFAARYEQGEIVSIGAIKPKTQ